MAMIGILNFGTGNLRSVKQALLAVAPQSTVTITADLDEIAAVERIVLPGQGAIGTWMKTLEDKPYREAIIAAIESKPTLGICLGLQALYHHSEENEGIKCLDRWPGVIKRFDGRGARLKIPHMGWNNVRQTVAHPLWRGIPDQSRFYFVHSYYAPLEGHTVGSCDYGIPFAAAAADGSIFAVQFHPEKSQQHGLQLFRNFLEWDGIRHKADARKSS